MPARTRLERQRRRRAARVADLQAALVLLPLLPCFFGAAGMMFAANDLSILWRLVIGLPLTLATVFLGGVFGELRSRASALRQGTAERFLEPDNPASGFCLYLRNFSRERVETNPAEPVFGWVAPPEQHRPVELALTRHLDIPVVALSDPRKPLLPGAYRVEAIADEDWQERLRELAGRASLVAVYVSEMTDAIRYELHVLRELPNLPALVILGREFGPDAVRTPPLRTLLPQRGPDAAGVAVLSLCRKGADVGASLQALAPGLVVSRSVARRREWQTRVAGLWVITPLMALIAGSFTLVYSPDAVSTPGPGWGMSILAILGVCALILRATSRRDGLGWGVWLRRCGWLSIAASLVPLSVWTLDSERWAATPTLTFWFAAALLHVMGRLGPEVSQ